MKRTSIVPALLFLAACATTGEIPEQRTDRSIVSVQTNTGTSDMQLTRDAAIRSDAVEKSADVVWAMLPQVYEQLGITVTGVNGPSRLLTSITRPRRIGGKGMSTYFDCPGAYGNVATSGDVYLSLRSQVIPAGDSLTTVRHEVEAVARSSTGAISQVQCSSKGALEALLTKTLEDRLAGG